MTWKERYMFCPNCGRQIPEGSRFCGLCGTRINIQTSQNNGAPVNGTNIGVPVPSKKSKKTGLIIAIAAAAVVIVAAVILLFTIVLMGKSGSENEAGVVNDTEENVQADTENADAEGDSDIAGGQEIYYTLASSYVVDSSGAETLYSTSEYENGILVYYQQDQCALYDALGLSFEFSYYLNTTQYNSNGDLQKTELHYITDDYEYDQVYEFEYEYNSSGNPDSVYIVIYEEQYEEEYEYYMNITLAYAEDGSLESVYTHVIMPEELEDDVDYLGDLYFQFSESSDGVVMSIEYEASKTYECEALYEFDPDGNLTEISCDGGLMVGDMTVVATSAANILSCCGAAYDYCDSNLAQLLASGGSVSYQYNEQGECTYEYLELDDDSYTTTWEYTYDDDGNLTQKTESYEADDYSYTETWEYIYDVDGNLTKVTASYEEIDYYYITYYEYE